MSGRHYLDHASTSPLRPQAATAITEWMSAGIYSDPGRQYDEGRQARDAVEQARHHVATLFSVREREVIFTGSGTEAANTANGAVRDLVANGSFIACAPVEHSAVRLSAERLGKVADIPVDYTGRLDVDAVHAMLAANDKPALVHCQFANHEVATRQPVEEIIALCREAGVLVHVDACAAAGQIPLDLGALGADFVSVSAHKFGGPPGVGALIVRRGRRLQSMLVGGEQERGRRAGFENVLGIVGFGAVAEFLAEPLYLADQAVSLRKATERLLHNALSIEGVVAYGDTDDRLLHMICLGVYGVEAEGVVLSLDQAGVAVHSGSACSSESFEPSPVLQAMGVDAERSLRISVGWTTTDDDISSFGESFKSVVASLRALRD